MSGQKKRINENQIMCDTCMLKKCLEEKYQSYSKTKGLRIFLDEFFIFSFSPENMYY